MATTFVFIQLTKNKENSQLQVKQVFCHLSSNKIKENLTVKREKNPILGKCLSKIVNVNAH